MRRRSKITLFVLLALVVLIAGGYIYLFPAGGLEPLVSGTLNDLLPEELGLDVRIGELRGNLISGIILENVTVTYRDSLGAMELAHASRVVSAYSLSNLWNRDYRFELVEIDSLSLTLRTDSTGQYRLPEVRRGEGEGRPAGAEFQINRLALRHADVRLVRTEDTLALEDLNLVASVSADGGMLSTDLQQLRFLLDHYGITMTAATGKLTYANKQLLFQDFMVVTNQARARLNGTLQPNPLVGRIEFAIDGFNPEELEKFGLPRLRGNLDLTGSVNLQPGKFDGSANLAGNFQIFTFENLQTDFSFENKALTLDTLYGSILGGCIVDGSAQIDFGQKPELYTMAGSIRNFNLNRLIEGTFPSDLNGRVTIDGSSFRNAELRLTVATELYESSFDEYPIQRGGGTMVITTDSIMFPEPFAVSYFENDFLASGAIAYSGEMQLFVDADLQNLSRYQGKLFIDQPAGRGHAQAFIGGATNDPDLRGTFVSDSLWLFDFYSDSAIAHFDIDRFLNGREGSVSADFNTGAAWGTPFDTALTRLRLDSMMVFIDTTFIQSELLNLSGGGSFDYGSDPSQLLLDTLTLQLIDQTFFNRGPVAVGIDSLGFLFSRATIGKRGRERGDLVVSGRIDYAETLDIDLVVDSILLGPWAELFQYDVNVNGYVSCEAEVGGSLVNPTIALTGGIDSLTYRGLVLGEMAAAAEYDRRLLTIDSLVIVSDSGRYHSSGYMNIDLSLVRGAAERLPDLPLDISFSAEDTEFDLVSLVMPSVEQLDGKFWADFRLFGTPSDPHLEGEMYLRNGRLKYFDLVQNIYTDSASVTMEDNRIVVKRLEAYVRDEKKDRRSYAYIEGDIVLQSLDNFVYDLDISIPREFPFEYELDDISGVIEGDLQIRGDTPPTIYGDITVVSGRYQVPFAEPDEGSPILAGFSDEDSWNLDINFDILSNYWIENQDIDAEFSGEVNMIREDGEYRFIGEMEILRGRAYLFDKVFRFEDPSLVVFEDIEYFNPRLDVLASTYITGTRIGVEDTPERIELVLHFTGPLDTMDYEVISPPDVSKDDVPAMLALNVYTGENFQASGNIESRISQLVGTQISQIGSRQLSQIGVETFEIDPTYGGEFDPAQTRFTIGLYLPSLPGFYVYGRSTLSGTGEEVGFEYRFSRRVLVEGRRSEDEEYILNMKLHWEF